MAALINCKSYYPYRLWAAWQIRDWSGLTWAMNSEPHDRFETEVDQPGQWRLSCLTAWTVTAIRMEVVTTRLNWRIRSELTLGYVRARSGFSWYNSELRGRTNRRPVVRWQV